MTVETMTDDNFMQLIQESKKLVIDVWAKWCGPCKKTTPVFNDMAEKSTDNSLVFAELDADNQRTAASQLKISGLPTFLVFENGSMSRRWTGGDVGRLRKEISNVMS